ncbi:MAG: glycosyltransferase family 39 protein [Oscillospiraceae bacterium]|nr:glycosyltransferase family 39 protein [Oscillospiraceae bacterium]
MISVLSFVGEVIFCALLVFICKKYFKDTIGKIASPVLAAIFIACLFLSNSWVQKMPIVYDEVGIVALDEKNEKSQGVEVSVQGIEFRGIKKDFPKISEGKWFFTTEDNYMWRPENDARQPEGTTKSIVLKVPVGTERTLLFRKSDWGGKAQVGFWNQKVVVDTYTTTELELENSGIRRQILQAAGRLFIFGVIMCAFAFLIYVLCRISQSENEKLKRKTVYVAAAVVFLVLAVSHFGPQELWLDEIYQVAFSGTGKNLYETLMVTETTPPLFRLIANIWYNIVPYGEEWLLLLSALLCAGFIYTMGLIGEEIGGKYVGYTASLLAAASPALLSNAAKEFRPYSLLVLLVSITLLFYVRNLKSGRNSVAFTISMILLAYTHYFGVFICGALFILDICYLCIKKRTIKDFIPYVIALVLFIPWVFRLFSMGHLEMEATFHRTPSIRAIYDLFVFLCGDVKVVIVFAVGIVAILLNHKKNERFLSPAFSILAVVFIMIVCVYAYGVFIRPTATLWKERYFLNILPCTIAITSYGLVWFARFLLGIFKQIYSSQKLYINIKKALCFVLPMILLLGHIPNITSGYSVSGKNDYKGAAETIYGHVDAYRDDSLVVMICRDYIVDGWYEYYMTMQGKRDDVNCVSVTEIPTDEKEAEEFFKPYNTIYYCYLWFEQGSPTFFKQLSTHYKAQQDNTSTCVRVYKRID